MTKNVGILTKVQLKEKIVNYKKQQSKLRKGSLRISIFSKTSCAIDKTIEIFELIKSLQSVPPYPPIFISNILSKTKYNRQLVKRAIWLLRARSISAIIYDEKKHQYWIPEFQKKHEEYLRKLERQTAKYSKKLQKKNERLNELLENKKVKIKQDKIILTEKLRELEKLRKTSKLEKSKLGYKLRITEQEKSILEQEKKILTHQKAKSEIELMIAKPYAELMKYCKSDDDYKLWKAFVKKMYENKQLELMNGHQEAIREAQIEQYELQKQRSSEKDRRLKQETDKAWTNKALEIANEIKNRNDHEE